MENKLVLNIDVDNFTHEDFKNFKKEFKLTNADIALITGTSIQNIKNQSGKNRPVSKWSRALLFMWELNKQTK